MSWTGDAQSSLFVIGGPIKCFSIPASSWIDEDGGGGGGGGPWYPRGGGTNGCPKPIGCPKSRESVKNNWLNADLKKKKKEN